jgi:hypothetical protein
LCIAFEVNNHRIRGPGKLAVWRNAGGLNSPCAATEFEADLSRRVFGIRNDPRIKRGIRNLSRRRSMIRRVHEQNHKAAPRVCRTLPRPARRNTCASLNEVLLLVHGQRKCSRRCCLCRVIACSSDCNCVSSCGCTGACDLACVSSSTAGQAAKDCQHYCDA